MLIVGGGITGLLIALKLYKDHQLTVIDIGPDPRFNVHTFGATYSGLDARHISFTETDPWTSTDRIETIMTSSVDKGWLCIPKKDLTDFEKKWILKFQETARNELIHKSNTSEVIELNKRGILEWEKLGKEYDFLKPISYESVMPIICRNREDLIGEYDFESSLDKRSRIYKNMILPNSLKPLLQRQEELGNLGYFTVYGKAYSIKTICNKLIDFLKSEGVSFLWNKSYSNIPTDTIVWASGVSLEASNLLEKFSILLGGVIGCWIAMDNPGITQACKIYAGEPVNYINITPEGSNLYLSGGYGFVGVRPYGEAVKMAQPIIEYMTEEVKKWFPGSKIKNKAFCVRPSTPTGVPVLIKHKLNKIPIIFAVGHCAGGFTQAPYTAERVKSLMEET